MVKLDNGLKNFFTYWFSGLKKAFKEIDKDSLDKILEDTS